MSPALTGGFFTSELPELYSYTYKMYTYKSYTVTFKNQFISLNVLKALT